MGTFPFTYTSVTASLRSRSLTKSLLLASCALVALSVAATAADLPARTNAAAPSPALVGNWSGFYVGAQVGYGWGTASIPWAVNPPYTNWQPSADQPGAMGGLHIGYNHQLGRYVLGIEADAELTNQRGKDGDSDPNAVEQNHKGSIRARAGAVMGSALIYATGGIAFLSADATRQATSEKVGTSYTGWTLGAGTEYMLSRNWSARAEYRYEDFGHTDMAFAGYGMRISPRTHGIRLGVSYRFGG